LHEVIAVKGTLMHVTEKYGKVEDIQRLIAYSLTLSQSKL